MNLSTELTKCYKLPWSESDNPNGWIEPISYCNIYCPGCYRGSEQKGVSEEPLSLEVVEKQIDWLIANRNIHTLSIAGGEPTLYPFLKETIAYANKKKLRVMLFTNALIMTREWAEELALAGLTQLVIHVDRFQKRADMETISAMQLRQNFVDQLKGIPNLQLGFIQPISASCEQELASLMDFLKLNFSKVNLMIFTIYRNICNSDQPNDLLDNELKITHLLNSIRKFTTVVPTAYLPSVGDAKEPTWLFSQRFGVDGAIFGDVSSSLYKLVHERYRSKNGRSLFVSRSNTVFWSSLLKFSFKNSIFKTIKNYLLHGIKTGNWNKGNLNFQTFLLLRGPMKVNGTWDLCDGCPDRMIYNGKLVPSCILENLKNQKNDTFKNVQI